MPHSPLLLGSWIAPSVQKERNHIVFFSCPAALTSRTFFCHFASQRTLRWTAYHGKLILSVILNVFWTGTGLHRRRNFLKSVREGRPQRPKTSPTPKLHFLLGFRPLYFRMQAQIGKKRDKTKNRPKSSATDLHLQIKLLILEWLKIYSVAQTIQQLKFRFVKCSARLFPKRFTTRITGITIMRYLVVVDFKLASN